MFNRLITLFFPLLYIINKVFPINRDRVLFCTKSGQFNGNAKYFFYYLIQKKAKHPIWKANDEKNYNNLCEEFGTNNIFLSKGFIGKIRYILNYLTAGTIIIRGRTDAWDLMRLGNRKKRKIINVGHGIVGPGMKRGGAIWNSGSKKKIKQEQKMRRAVSHYITSSDLMRYVVAAGTSVEINKIYITGMPRNDHFVNARKNIGSIIKKIKSLVRTNIDIQKVILYAPTHRDGNTTRFFPFDDFSISHLQNILIKNKAIMLLRTHDQQNKFLNDELGNFKEYTNDRIFYFSHFLLSDINEIIPGVDLLLSDYSSITSDYLLVDKPIIYIPYDLLTYGRGIHFSDYDNWTPGPKVYTSESFYSAIEQSLTDPIKYSSDRKKLKNFLHKYFDSNSCERLLGLINRKVQ